MGLLYGDLTYFIQGAIFEVHNSLGPGFDEETYHLALERKLTFENIPFQSKVTKDILHRSVKVHKFVADLIVDKKVIIELKSIQKEFHSAHYSQILSYLKCWQLEIGQLVNFGLPRAFIKRIIYQPALPQITEDYTFIKDLINDDNRMLLRAIRKSILNVFEMHGTGYEASIYAKILKQEFIFQNLNFETNQIIPVHYDGYLLRQYELKIPIIGNQIMCSIIAQKDNIKSDIMNLKTYLKSLNLQIGLIIHLGKNKCEIQGVPPR